MKKIKNTYFLLGGFIFFILLIFSGSFLIRNLFFKDYGIHPTMAAGGPGNVSGFAWGENFGWVSFNSDDCDTDKNGYIDTDAMVNGCGGNNTSTVAFPYGVNADAAGNLSGYAWSENVGWIYFGPDATLAGYGSVASSSAPGLPRTWAQLNSGTGFITGWANILSLGNEGWIKMSDSSVVNWNADGLKVVASGTDSFINGWAWGSGNDSASGSGWLSFNCANGGPTKNNICSTSNYKVVISGLSANNPPVITNPAVDMTAPNWSKSDACGSLGALRANLVWKYSDPDMADTVSAYRIVLTDLTVPSTVDTGKCTEGMTGSGYCTISPASCSGGQCQYPVGNNLLTYNHRYSWQAQIWDGNDAPSALADYISATDVPAEVDDGVAGAFTTFVHEFPDPKFSWTPVSPSRDEVVFYDDLSRVATAGNTFVDATSTNANWFWTFENSIATSSVVADPQNRFTASTASLVTLKVTNKDIDYSCSTSTSVNINLKMPTWKEEKSQ